MLNLLDARNVPIGIKIAYRPSVDRVMLHAIVTAHTWEEIAEFMEGDEDIVDYTPLWDLSGEYDGV